MSLSATATGFAPSARDALERDLREAAARHGAHLELASGVAADLEAVLLDLMDEQASGSTAPTGADAPADRQEDAR